MKVSVRIEWSYPTSPNAVNLGFGKTGCYSVERIVRNPIQQPPEAIKGFNTLEEAERFAIQTGLPWDSLTRRA